MKAKLLPTTGIGSLPHLSSKEAIEYSLKYDIPFLPELTNREDSTNISNIKNFICFPDFMEKVNTNSLFKTQSFLELNPKIYSQQVHFIDDPEKIFNNIDKKMALHCCNKIKIHEIENLNLTHLSFDASLVDDPESFLRYLIQRNITPVVGLVSTHEENYKICDNYEQWKLLLKNNITNCWISPACGLSSFTIQQTEEILELLKKVQREILVSLC